MLKNYNISEKIVTYIIILYNQLGLGKKSIRKINKMITYVRM